MLRKIKSYYRVFGFRQTFLKLFRYANEKLHTDRYGIYTPTAKEKKHIVDKKQRVYIFSDSVFSRESKNLSSKCAVIFNSFGCDVYYYSLKERIVKQKNPPLSFYGCFSVKSAENLSFQNCVVVLDTEGDLRQALVYKTKKDRCTVIDSRQCREKITEEYCAEVLNKLKGKERCPDRFFDNISVVILNYNNKNVIYNCLDTLIKYNRRYQYEIIVVDNQSTDGSYEELIEKYDTVKIYRNEKNGCSSGRNIGIENATKDYVIFLDSDQWILHQNWLDVYFEVLERADNAGAIGWIGGWFNRKGYSYHTVNNFSYGYMPPKALCRNDIGYLGTGGMMVERKLLNEIGGFDLNYDPTCYEDTDISLKIRNAGREIYYCPYLGVGHLPHQTTKSGSESHEKLIKAKGEYFVNKWKKKNSRLLKYVK